MMALLSPRLWLALGLAVLLAVSHGMAYKSGRAAVRAQWDKERAEQMAVALAASEANRKKEQELQTKVAKVTNDYLAEKKRGAAAAAVNAGRLSELEAALDRAATPDTSATASADDPAIAIARQCARSLFLLDDYAAGLAGQVRGLQDYTKSVCVTP